MDIKYALLGFLDWKPATGYELKKLITGAIGFEWSGNNNQVYTSLVQLHSKGLVNSEVQAQERYPDRKIYSITEDGREVLRDWVLSDPKAPQMKKDILVQIAWADRLTDAELLDMLERYRTELKAHLLMNEERVRRSEINPARTKRESYLWHMIGENYLAGYRTELKWTNQLIDGIKTGGY